MIYVFFILPVKVKWLAWISAGFLLLGFVTSPNSYRMALIAAFANYLIFFGPERGSRGRATGRQIASRRQRFEESRAAGRRVAPSLRDLRRDRADQSRTSNSASRATARNIASRISRARPANRLGA